MTRRTPSSAPTCPLPTAPSSSIRAARHFSRERRPEPDPVGRRSSQWISARRNCGEDALSYALRLAETNGFGRTERFFREAGIRRGDILKGSGLDRLARIGSSDPALLALETPVVGRAGIRLADQHLHRYQWSSTVRRFCPRCFADDIDQHRHDLTRPLAWNRVWWNMPEVLTCIEHDLALKEACECGRPLGWSTASVARCRCGRDLRLAETRVVRCEADRYIVGRLGFSTRIAVPLLDGMPLADAIRAIKIFSEATPASENGTARTKVFRMLRQPEAGFSAFLAKVAAGRCERPGAMTRFGAVYAFTRERPPGSAREQLLSLMKTNVRLPNRAPTLAIEARKTG